MGSWKFYYPYTIVSHMQHVPFLKNTSPQNWDVCFKWEAICFIGKEALLETVCMPCSCHHGCHLSLAHKTEGVEACISYWLRTVAHTWNSKFAISSILVRLVMWTNTLFTGKYIKNYLK